MSVEERLASIDGKLTQFIESQKDICQIKHKPVDEHLESSNPVRDTVSELKGAVTVLTRVCVVTLIGMFGIAAFVVRQSFIGG